LNDVRIERTRLGHELSRRSARCHRYSGGCHQGNSQHKTLSSPTVAHNNRPGQCRECLKLICAPGLSLLDALSASEHSTSFGVCKASVAVPLPELRAQPQQELDPLHLPDPVC